MNASDPCKRCEKPVIALSLLCVQLARLVDETTKIETSLHIEGSGYTLEGQILGALRIKLPELAAQVDGYCSLECRRQRVQAKAVSP